MLMQPLSAPPEHDLDDRQVGLVSQAVLIREFESRLLRLFAEGKLNGTVHTCVGQEFVGVAVGDALSNDDLVVSNHRGHGHYLAMHDNPVGLLAEIMGRVDGVCGGTGGSQHLIGPNFLSSGIQAGMTPIAVGAALASRLGGQQGIVVSFIGDGTLGEGLLYESLNLASMLHTPVLFVVENNRYAQSTATSTTMTGSVAARAAAFDLPCFQGDTWNWPLLVETAATAVREVRQSGTAAVLEVMTYRLNAHSKGDDNRDPDEVARFREVDPLERFHASGAEWYATLIDDARHRIDEAVSTAERSSMCSYSPRAATRDEPVTWAAPRFSRQRHADSIHAALREALQSDESVLLLGEDIEGPYGGAFKITKSLSLDYPGRVLNTPISEAGIVGLGTGLAYRGHKPVVEIMFGDFLTLTLDQLLQHAAKFRDMYGGDVSVPLIVRTPMGGRRGYGPTHSQSLEKFFLGVPGLNVIALNNRFDPGEVYRRLLDTITDPTLVIENKTLYTRFLDDAAPDGFVLMVSDELLPTVKLSPLSISPDVTIVCYGGMLEEAERAQLELFEQHEIAAEIICPTVLHPLNIEPIATAVAISGRMVVVEEGPDVAGFGSEVTARLAERGVGFNVARRGYNGLIPASAPREQELLVGSNTITAMAIDLLND
jgi:2-oxoisovalerate dehydrogenase E1 component